MEKILIKNAILVNENKISQKDLLIKGEYIYKIDDCIEEINVEKTIDAKEKDLTKFISIGLSTITHQ